MTAEVRGLWQKLDHRRRVHPGNIIIAGLGYIDYKHLIIVLLFYIY